MGIKAIIRDLIFVYIGYQLIVFSITENVNLTFLALFGAIIISFTIWFSLGRFFKR